MELVKRYVHAGYGVRDKFGQPLGSRKTKKACEEMIEHHGWRETMIVSIRKVEYVIVNLKRDIKPVDTLKADKERKKPKYTYVAKNHLGEILKFETMMDAIKRLNISSIAAFQKILENGDLGKPMKAGQLAGWIIVRDERMLDGVVIPSPKRQKKDLGIVATNLDGRVMELDDIKSAMEYFGTSDVNIRNIINRNDYIQRGIARGWKLEFKE